LSQEIGKCSIDPSQYGKGKKGGKGEKGGKRNRGCIAGPNRGNSYYMGGGALLEAKKSSAKLIMLYGNQAQLRMKRLQRGEKKGEGWEKRERGGRFHSFSSSWNEKVVMTVHSPPIGFFIHVHVKK